MRRESKRQGKNIQPVCVMGKGKKSGWAGEGLMVWRTDLEVTSDEELASGRHGDMRRGSRGKG